MSMSASILRTPDERFENLNGFNFAPHYMEIDGKRIHYITEGEGDPILCLHGEPSWCYLYRKMIPTLQQQGKVIAPDFIGFGKSDKLPKISDYSFKLHYDMLHQFIEKLQLKNITLVVQDWGGLIGLSYAADHPEKFKGLVIMNTGLPSGIKKGNIFTQFKRALPFLIWQNYARFVPKLSISKIVASGCAVFVTDDIKKAYDAPFPDESYKAGARAFPLLVPSMSTQHPSAVYTARAKEKLAQWPHPVLIMFSDKDPITRGQFRLFEKIIPGSDPSKTITIQGAGHFLQEDKGEEIAENIVKWLQSFS
jgi:haloalkane dehalogenase